MKKCSIDIGNFLENIAIGLISSIAGISAGLEMLLSSPKKYVSINCDSDEEIIIKEA